MRPSGILGLVARHPRVAAEREHAGVVADWASVIAREMGFTGEHVERIALAGRLHDIGKLHVPRAILDTPGPLDAAKWKVVRRHPEYGARLLGDPVFDDIRPWVLFHHERPDGRGYPFGIDGDVLPIEAAIIAVADAWSAMTADRPYRRAMCSAVAAAELREGSGTQWRTDCVDALLAVLGRAVSLRVGVARTPARGRDARHARICRPVARSSAGFHVVGSED